MRVSPPSKGRPFGVGDPSLVGWSSKLSSDSLPGAPGTLSNPLLPLACPGTAGTQGDMPKVPWKLSGRDRGVVCQLWLIKSPPIPHLHRSQFDSRTQAEGTWTKGSLIFIVHFTKTQFRSGSVFPCAWWESGTRGRDTTMLCHHHVCRTAPPGPQVPVNHGKATEAPCRQLEVAVPMVGRSWAGSPSLRSNLSLSWEVAQALAGVSSMSWLGIMAPCLGVWHHAGHTAVPVSCRMQQGASSVPTRSCSPMAPNLSRGSEAGGRFKPLIFAHTDSPVLPSCCLWAVPRQWLSISGLSGPRGASHPAWGSMPG